MDIVRLKKKDKKKCQIGIRIMNLLFFHALKLWVFSCGFFILQYFMIWESGKCKLPCWWQHEVNLVQCLQTDWAILWMPTVKCPENHKNSICLNLLRSACLTLTADVRQQGGPTLEAIISALLMYSQNFKEYKKMNYNSSAFPNCGLLKTCQ